MTAVLDLGELRTFVTFASLADLVAAAPHERAEYFERFGPEDDATLLVYTPVSDPVHAGETVLGALSEAGVDVDACGDVFVVNEVPEERLLDRLTRRAQAVVGPTAPSLLTMDRPAYAWDEAGRLRTHADRHLGITAEAAPYSYTAAIEHLVGRGWTTREHVTVGSIPEASLERLTGVLDRADLGDAPRVLHVGNFVGVSLSYLLEWCTRRPQGVTVSVDPGIPHRDVAHPQDAVADLLAHFGLTERHLLLCGYSLEKSLSNDGVVFDGYDPAAAWSGEAAPENVLATLAMTGSTFDVALIDGNHDPAYLRRELSALVGLLRPGGLLVLDDVDEWWEGIQALFDEVVRGDWPFEQVLADGRIGVLRRR